MGNFVKYLFLGLFFFSFQAFTREKWIINQDHSEIFFKANYLQISDVTGRFNNFSGEVFFEEGSRVPLEIRLEIQSKSIDTGNNMRDGHLRGGDFFKADSFPVVKFMSREVILKGKNNYEAEGVLNIKEIHQKIRVQFYLTEKVKDTWGFENRFAQFKGVIKRSDFKMSWNKTLTGNNFLVSDEIHFWGTFQLQLGAKVTPKSKHMIPDTPAIRRKEQVNRGELSPLPEKIELISSPSIPTTKLVVEKGVVKSPGVLEIKRSILWWLGFSFLGFFGFIGAITMSIYVKKYVAKIFIKYEEGGMLGNLSDLVILIFTLIFAQAFWLVGWGS